MGSARPAGTAGNTTGDVVTGGDEVPDGVEPWNSELTSNFRRVGLAAARTLVFEGAVGAGAAVLTGTALLVLAEVGVPAFKVPGLSALGASGIGWACKGGLERVEFVSPIEPKLMGDDVSAACID